MKKTGNLRYYLLLALYIYFIFSNSMTNGTDSQANSDIIVTILENICAFIKVEIPYEATSYIIRKLAHLTEFAILGILTYWVLKKTENDLRLFPYVFIIPVMDELIQTTSPGRSCQIKDIVIDSVGILVGYLLFNRKAE